MKYRAVIVALLTVMSLTATAGNAAAALLGIPAIPRDTTRYGEDDERDEDGTFAADTAHKPRNLVPNGHNIIHDVLENRYLPGGETFRKGKAWMRNMYLQLGVGGEKILPSSDNFEISMMPQVQFGAGKHLSKLHSVRLMGHASWGYLNEDLYKFSKFGLKADYIYDLSGYFDGFNPTRQLNLSAIVGLGGQYSKMSTETGISGEAHMGLQMRFYTGPHGYVSVEPYLGIASDQVDVSKKRNWRSTDIFYGVNINYIYYLYNNLSPESWKRLVLQADSSQYDKVSKDYHVESWQQPWFVQFSNGLSLMKSPSLGMGETMGSEVALQGGKWLSPVIGLRATLFQRTNVWRKVVVPANEANFHPSYTVDRHNVYMGFRLEAMANPLGFMKNFQWDKPWGFYLVGGFEKGWLQKQQEQPLSCSTFGWGGGVNLWYQPTPGLKIFVEPRFMHNEYSIPYRNAENRSKRYGDDNITLSVGLTVEERDDKRFYKHSYEEEFITDRLRPWTVGGALGLNFLQTQSGYTGGVGLSYNGQLFGEYHFDRLKGVRLGIEYVGLSRDNITRFTDYNMDDPNAPEDYSPVEREGLWSHKYGLLLVSPGALIDLNHLMMHYRPQKLRLFAYAGPTAVFMLNYKREISPMERIMENHRVEPTGDLQGSLSFGAHIGFKLEYHWKKKLNFYISPTAYSLITTKVSGIDFTRLKLMETVNIGVQYSFGKPKM